MIKKIGIVFTATALSLFAPGSGQVLNNQITKAMYFAVAPWLAIAILVLSKLLKANIDVIIVVGGILVGVSILAPMAAALEAGLVAYKRRESSGVWRRFPAALLFAFLWILITHSADKSVRRKFGIPYFKPGTLTIDPTPGGDPLNMQPVEPHKSLIAQGMPQSAPMMTPRDLSAALVPFLDKNWISPAIAMRSREGMMSQAEASEMVHKLREAVLQKAQRDMGFTSLSQTFLHRLSSVLVSGSGRGGLSRRLGMVPLPKLEWLELTYGNGKT